ncbi:unnamed protein product [Echinostoma caproni]|uniref:Bestrophin homolog n=1 Tax=Echinostoma caproni TaxID=27848 RepID=A0A183AEC1_9TREM|nr:unnamed protein product [Echinostoma caproni]
MFVADTLSRATLPDTGQEQKLESVNVALAVTQLEMYHIRTATIDDPSMQEHKGVITRGWPEDKKALPMDVLPYFKFRDELTVHDELIFGGESTNLTVPNDEELRRSFDQLDLYLKPPTPIMATQPESTPHHELCCFGHTDLKEDTIMCNTHVSAESPISHVSVPESPTSKGAIIRNNSLEICSDLVNVVRSVDLPTLDWLRMHHQYQMPQSNDFPHICDPSHSGDGVSEHWSTHLSPTMRSETSLHPSITLHETEYHRSHTSDLCQPDEPEQPDCEADENPDPMNPTISVLADDSPVESTASPVISPSQFETIMAVTSIVDRSPSGTMLSPSGINVEHYQYAMYGHPSHQVPDNAHLLRPTITDNVIMTSTPSGDAE